MNPTDTPSIVAQERSKRYAESQNATVPKATNSSRCQMSDRNSAYIAPRKTPNPKIGRNIHGIPKSMYDSAAYPNAIVVPDSRPATRMLEYFRTFSLSDISSS